VFTVLWATATTRNGVKDMPLIPDAATVQKSFAMLPISMYEPGEVVIAAGATTGIPTGPLLLKTPGIKVPARAGRHRRDARS
jgi:hypothetical protein